MRRTALAAGLAFLLVPVLAEETVVDWKSIAVPVSEAEYRCPVQPGATISQGNFGSFSHQRHFAWDYQVPIGTLVVAARSGVVVQVRTNSNIGSGDRRFENDANEVRVRHTDGTVAFYFHLAKNASLVREGEFVLQGETIALSGNTGFSTMPHLHFEVFRDDKSVPATFADFPRNGGVPDVGDKHSPPAGPAVPQKTIFAYKKLHRAAVIAEQRGWPALGLAILRAAPESKEAGAWHYARVVNAQRASFRAAVDLDIARLTGAPITTFPLALKAKLMAICLRDQPDSHSTVLKLAEAEAAFPEDLKRAFQGSAGALAALAEGMRFECFEDIQDAGGKYLTAREAGRGEVRAEALRNVKRLIDLYLDRSVSELARLKDEAERGLPEHMVAIRADGERVIKLCRSLFQYLHDWFPERRADAERDLKVVNYFWTRISRDTK